MKQADYIKAIEKQVEEQQAIQQVNAPTTAAWQAASKQIHHLALLITAAQNHYTYQHNFLRGVCTLKGCKAAL